MSLRSIEEIAKCSRGDIVRLYSDRGEFIGYYLGPETKTLSDSKGNSHNVHGHTFSNAVSSSIIMGGECSYQNVRGGNLVFLEGSKLSLDWVGDCKFDIHSFEVLSKSK